MSMTCSDSAFFCVLWSDIVRALLECHVKRLTPCKHFLQRLQQICGSDGKRQRTNHATHGDRPRCRNLLPGLSYSNQLGRKKHLLRPHQNANKWVAGLKRAFQTFRLVLLRSESPSGMCAKLHAAAASNNRAHTPQSLYHCLFAPPMYGVILRAHPVSGESHIQRNATGEVATV